jgi:hypothetical protein
MGVADLAYPGNNGMAGDRGLKNIKKTAGYR